MWAQLNKGNLLTHHPGQAAERRDAGSTAQAHERR